MLGRLLRMPAARALLPFVRLSYAQPSQYSWYDEDGVRRTVTQAEGGEQGDPLMPLLFFDWDSRSLGGSGDGATLRVLGRRVEAMMRIAGIRLHQGKTRAWNNAGVVPNDILNVGAEAWQPEGITVLGTPIGSELYITERMEERISKE